MPETRELLTWHISERIKETIWKEIGTAESWEALTLPTYHIYTLTAFFGHCSGIMGPRTGT